MYEPIKDHIVGSSHKVAFYKRLYQECEEYKLHDHREPVAHFLDGTNSNHLSFIRLLPEDVSNHVSLCFIEAFSEYPVYKDIRKAIGNMATFFNIRDNNNEPSYYGNRNNSHFSEVIRLAFGMLDGPKLEEPMAASIPSENSIGYKWDGEKWIFKARSFGKNWSVSITDNNMIGYVDGERLETLPGHRNPPYKNRAERRKSKRNISLSIN